MIPLSLYVHFPWCLRKCPYCDFNSHAVRGDIPEAAYLAAVVRDLDRSAAAVAGRRIESIFIGGGTPSLMTPAGLDRLLAACQGRCSLAADIEITIEANPGTVDAGRFAAFRAAGINRLSLGIQSFDDAKLAALGRIHDAAAAVQAIESAQRHFDRVNLDLMYALPAQTVAECRHDIDTAIAFGTGHVSAYQLTVEPNTAFGNAPPSLPDDDIAADMQDVVESRLAAAGYRHYETSAFAQPGQECRHNLNYWRFGDYLGIGAGAHAKLTCGGRIVREARCRHPADYMSRDDPVSARHEVAAAERPGEFMMNALRLNDGFDPALFPDRTGLAIDSVATALARAERDGLLHVTPDRIVPTALGRRHLNGLIARFI